MAFVGTSVAIASLWRVAARVRTRRNTEKLSWKRAVFESEVIILYVNWALARVSSDWKDIFHTL